MPLRTCVVCGRVTEGARCSAHQPERPYGWDHQQARAGWADRVAAGDVECRRAPYGRCVAPSPLIRPEQPWDLGHPDQDVPAPTAPEHRRCNRGAPNRRDA